MVNWEAIWYFTKYIKKKKMHSKTTTTSFIAEKLKLATMIFHYYYVCWGATWYTYTTTYIYISDWHAHTWEALVPFEQHLQHLLMSKISLPHVSLEVSYIFFFWSSTCGWWWHSFLSATLSCFLLFFLFSPWNSR